MIQNLKGAVNLLFGKYMFATNIISSGMLMGIGDLIQQQIEYCRNEKSVPIDYPRLGKCFVKYFFYRLCNTCTCKTANELQIIY